MTRVQHKTVSRKKLVSHNGTTTSQTNKKNNGNRTTNYSLVVDINFCHTQNLCVYFQIKFIHRTDAV